MVEGKQENRELELAREFVLNTDCNLYLTGKAGTGKTTFLREVRRNCPKRLVIAAPTGVAAINCGGVTLHSFFQLPFGPILPGADGNRQYKFSRQKVAIIKSLDLLVIDEVSMVRADMLDGVDAVLRRYRRSDKPFGGVQLLLIGDLHQLPPVVTDNDAPLLRRYYESAYFFHSNALKQTELVTIELQQIYRQADQDFVSLLNKVRDNRLDPETLQTLNGRLTPPSATDGDSAIMLCTHNHRADTINRGRLERLPEKAMLFSATVDGDFPEQGYPTEAVLELKTGAQVMFIRNDNSPEKQYFNGRIGTITKLSHGVIHVHCQGDRDDIVVEPSTWENIEYQLNEQTQEIVEHKIGEFVQFPLKLAWAITIHKSQGLTFDRAVIDAEAAFAHGQVYVALSRLRSLDGLILGSPLSSQAIRTDPTIVRFTAMMLQNTPTDEVLQRAKTLYEQKLLIDCYNFNRLRNLLHRFFDVPRTNPTLVQLSGAADLDQLELAVEKEICLVGDNFQRQLLSLFTEQKLPSTEPHILDRLQKATGYFGEKFATHLNEVLAKLQLETDNSELAKRIKNSRERLEEEIAAKQAGIDCCGRDFSPTNYLRALSAAELQLIATRKRKEPGSGVTYTEADVGHPVLYEELKTWRHTKAQTENVAQFQVMHLKTLIQIAVNLPDNLKDLKKLKGIGPKLAEKYGEELVDMVTSYRARHNITAVELPRQEEDSDQGKPSAKKGETIRVTLELVQEGLALEDIMSRRGLARSTVESHFVRLIQAGNIEPADVLAPEKICRIQQALEKFPGGTKLGDLKNTVEKDISYNEIKMVLAYQQLQEAP